jgi:hypothetical protein
LLQLYSKLAARPLQLPDFTALAVDLKAHALDLAPNEFGFSVWAEHATSDSVVGLVCASFRQ